MAWQQTPAPPSVADISATTATQEAIIGDGLNAFTPSSGQWDLVRIGQVVYGSAAVGWNGKGSASGDIFVSAPIALGFYDGSSFNGMAKIDLIDGVTSSGVLSVVAEGGAYTLIDDNVILTDSAYATEGALQISVIFLVQ